RTLLINWFPGAEPANRMTLEANSHRGIGALLTQVREDTALDNAELRLARIGHRHVGRRSTARVLDSGAAAGGPPYRPLHRIDCGFSSGRISQALVEDHGDVRTQHGLGVHSR